MGEALVAAYFFCGLVYTFLEARTFEYEEDFRSLPKLDIALSVIIMAAHLFRACLTFPLYMLEDFCIFQLNKAAEERGDL